MVTNGDNLSILIADDHVLFRDALLQFIESLCPNWSISCFSDFDSAYAKIEDETIFDLILLDLRMPGMNGLNGLQKICSQYPNQKTAILSGVAEEHHVKQAMAMGACAYLPKTLSGKALIKAIDLVVNSDQKFIPMEDGTAKIMPAYYDDYNQYTPSTNNGQDTDTKIQLLNLLTKREKQVLHYLSQGLSNKEIAREIEIEVSTVKLHVGNLCHKMNADNRTQAAIMAHQ